MSSSASPIPPERFAEAIQDLPLPNLHFKAAEIRNSISHLESSNAQLQPYADEGQTDCADAIVENEETMRRMEERILLLQKEVERRGFKWGEDVDMRGADVQARTNGHTEGEMDVNGDVEAKDTAHQSASATRTRQEGTRGGSLSDEELATRLRERIEEDEVGDEDGVHL